jgi:sugar phosphate isomerase/epimerase
MNPHPSRRAWLAATAAAAAATPIAARAADPSPAEPFGYCLNTSTIRGQKLPIADEIELAAKAGYQAVEPWANELDAHVRAGGTVKDLAKRAKDANVVVADIIGFPEWVVDDEARRKKGFEEAKRVMGMAQELGCAKMAAPPAGATDRAELDLNKAAERYRALCELGETMSVTPVVEVWGFSKSIHRLSEAVFVAIESGHPRACVLPDTYHLYKGGSGFGGVRLLGPATVGIFHVNDYPSSPDRANIADANRVYPGDGVVPWKEVLRDLRSAGYRGYLSLELFNRDYWTQDALVVARTGLDKLRAVVAKSLAG